MGMTDILAGLKDRVLDAATYELLKRNFELLEDNNNILKDKVSLLQEERDRYKAETNTLQAQNRELQGKLSGIASEAEYVERAGLLFKKNADGTVQPAAYCPECRKRLTTIDNRIFICPSCKYTMNAGSSAAYISSVMNKEIAAKQNP